jgi:hypothetical protein
MPGRPSPQVQAQRLPGSGRRIARCVGASDDRRGLEYVVLERRPHEGLPRRTSTDLRGY